MKIYGNILQANILSKILSPGQTVNLGLTLSAGVLSVCASDGSALSATNPGFACIQSITAGKNLVVTFTANQTIQDKNHASPQILGRLGTTASVAWGSDMPIFLGIVNRDDTSANAKICLGRNPKPNFDSGASTNIGKAGTAASSSSQNNIIIADSSITVADYANKPVTAIGSVKATIDNSAGGSATITVLAASEDGVGKFQEGIRFSMPTGQNGNQSGKHHNVADGATNLVFSTTTMFYILNRSGSVFIDIRMDTASVNGSDGVLLRFYCPLICPNITSGSIINAAAAYTSANEGRHVFINEGNGYVSLRTAGSMNPINDDSFSGGANSYVYANISYPAF